MTAMSENSTSQPAPGGGSDRRLVRLCADWSRHDWKRDGSHRVATTSGYPGVPGTVEYLDYKCRLCGQHYAEISPYSFRADRNPNDQSPSVGVTKKQQQQQQQ